MFKTIFKLLFVLCIFKSTSFFAGKLENIQHIIKIGIRGIFYEMLKNGFRPAHRKSGHILYPEFIIVFRLSLLVKVDIKPTSLPHPVQLKKKLTTLKNMYMQVEL